MTVTQNPNDEVRDAILRKLYDIHAKGHWYGTSHGSFGHTLRPKYEEALVNANVEYLAQKGWVVVFDHGANNRHVKISAVGIDYIEGGTAFELPGSRISLNLLNIDGIVIIGDGNYVNQAHATDFRELQRLEKAVLVDDSVPAILRNEISNDLKSILAQLKNLQPEKTAISKLWERVRSAIEGAQFAVGVVELFAKIKGWWRP